VTRRSRPEDHLAPRRAPGVPQDPGRSREVTATAAAGPRRPAASGGETGARRDTSVLPGTGRSPAPDSTHWTPGGTNEIDARAAASLKAGRLAMGLTQREFADRAGLSKGMVCQLETGVKGFTTGTLIKVAAVLGDDPSDLIRPGRSVDATAPPDPDPPRLARRSVLPNVPEEQMRMLSGRTARVGHQRHAPGEVMGIKLIIEVLDHYHGPDARKLWLLAWAEKANDGTRAGWPTREVLAHRTGRSPVRVSNVASELVAEGVLKRDGGGNRGGPARYIMLPVGDSPMGSLRPNPSGPPNGFGLSEPIRDQKGSESTVKGSESARKGSGPTPLAAAMRSLPLIKPSVKQPSPPPTPRGPFPILIAVPDIHPEEEGRERDLTPNQLVAAIRRERPDWPTASIERALGDAAVTERPWPLVCTAALIVARDPESKHAGRLSRDGPWWAAAAAALGHSPRPPWCGRCDKITRLTGMDGDAPSRCMACHPSHVRSA